MGKYICTKCPSFLDFDENSLSENLCISAGTIKELDKNGNEVMNCLDIENCVVKQAILRAEKLADLFGVEEVK